jgi:hypothetical protein
MPKKLKQHMKETHNWAAHVVDKKATFENFLNKFGENFQKYPKIYKYGCYRRATFLAKKGEYLSAYKLIA